MIKSLFTKIDCWKTRVFAFSSHPFEKMNLDGDVIFELNHFDSITALTPLNVSITIEADPFLFVRGEKLYLFYETKIVGGKGIIKMTSTTDLKSWTAPITVLTEKCHLSYPFVFVFGGEIYMIPETGALKSIRLYKALDKNLEHWEFCKTLIEQDDDMINVESSFCDSSIVYLNGIYYLFTTIIRNNTNELHLYYSSSLDSSFQKHPMNPIIVSNRYGRDAGNVLEFDGALWRVAQECTNTYGENVNIAKIEEITTQTYKEQIIKDSFFDSKDSFYSDGAHQLNVVKFKDKFIIATDAKGYRQVLLQRLISKIKSYL